RQALLGCGVERREGGPGPRRTGGQIESLRVALEVGAIAGVERVQLELLGHRRAEQAIEVLEHLGHEKPRGARIEAEAAVLPRAGAPAERVARFEQRYPVAVGGEQGGTRETRDAATHHDRVAWRHRRPPTGSRRQRAASASLTVFGTEIRVVASRSAGVRSMRRSSSAKNAVASSTAR